jgi:hypothetical protein
MDTGDRQPAPTPLVPVREQAVDFYGDHIPGAITADGEVYIPLRPLTDFLGLAWSPQRLRALRDRVLAARLRTVHMTGADGRQRDLLCLPLDLLPGWLFGIDTSRVRTELAGRLDLYRAECFRVLWRAFQAETPALSGPVTAEGPLSLAQVRELGIALQQIAEQGMAHESRLTRVEGRLDNAARFIGQMQKRLERVEARVAPAALLTDEQRTTLTMRVKAVAVLILGRNPAAANPFQGIWTELFRELGVPDSHHIPQHKYQAALDFLDAWGRAVAGQGEPEHPPDAPQRGQLL